MRNESIVHAALQLDLILPSSLSAFVCVIDRLFCCRYLHSIQPHNLVTIDSSTYPHLTRVAIPHQTSALEPSDTTSSSSSSSTLSVAQICRTPPASASLIPATRTRSELEGGENDESPVFPARSPSPPPLSYLHPSLGITHSSSPTAARTQEISSELGRARKRQRIDSTSSSTSTSLASIERSLIPGDSTQLLTIDNIVMRSLETDGDDASFESWLEAGPSSVHGNSNGHNGVALKTNGFSHPHTNGMNGTSKTHGVVDVDGHRSNKLTMAVSRVSLPGKTLYEDSLVDREEFVRLVIQSLRDVGYIESAATLEAESGYIMESPEVAEFRRCILDGAWERAEEGIMRLGVVEDPKFWEAKFLISQQKYLELLEARNVTAALQVLRNELAPLNVDLEQLHSLSSLMMCTQTEELRERAAWDGAAGNSRRRLLVNLQRYIPSAVMIPQRRLATLLDQASMHQQSQCLYHNTPINWRTWSLYADHRCGKDAFPRVTTAILEAHSDEVWNLQWSHNGEYLASASKDKSAIIWRVGTEKDPSKREYEAEHILRDHPEPVGCVAWSPDDSILLTAADSIIRLWNVKTGLCMKSLNGHNDVVTALTWLPDGSGFISGGLDTRIILWDADGKQRDYWGLTPIRVTDLVVTPDFRSLVAAGMCNVLSTPPVSTTPPESGTPAVNAGAADASQASENRIIIYDLMTKQIEASVPVQGQPSSVKVSQDSQHALISRTAQDGNSDGDAANSEIYLWDLHTQQIVQKYVGHQQSQHVIRSCFGGVDGNFVASGSEDGNVYIWHRDTGTLLEVLSGHGAGSVNSVAWNPRNPRVFATCSDDHTIRIWDAPPSDGLSSVVNRNEYPEWDHEIGKGKGKGRERWAGDAAGVVQGPGSSSTSF